MQQRLFVPFVAPIEKEDGLRSLVSSHRSVRDANTDKYVTSLNVAAAEGTDALSVSQSLITAMVI